MQLINSVLFSIANYWLQIFPLPKKVVKHIEGICRSFLWTGKSSNSRKAPISWDHMCDPKYAGGLNLIGLEDWNKASIGKLLWNIWEKKDKLWIHWIHIYYMKNIEASNFQPGRSCSWTMKAIFKHKNLLTQSAAWGEMHDAGKYSMRKMYQVIRGVKPQVEWRKLLIGNHARPRAIFTLWMACNKRLLTKDRMNRFGMATDGLCVFCKMPETCQHLLFNCSDIKPVWEKILNWIGFNHTPAMWDEELKWIVQNTKGKGCKRSLLKMAVAETTYMIWCVRNWIIFQDGRKEELQYDTIKNVILRRVETNRKLMMYCSMNI